jgi:hypothetical protein
MDKFNMAEYFTIGEIETFYAQGYITICAGGDIEIIMKEREEE